jgi:hypothetical protein
MKRPLQSVELKNIQSLNITHCLPTLKVKHTEYDNQNQTTKNPSSGIIPQNNMYSLLLKTTPDTDYDILKFTLCSAPQFVSIQINGRQIRYGHTLSITSDDISITFKNETTQEQLLRLPKQGSSIQRGSKNQPCISKSFFITNINIPCITIFNSAYQKPIDSSNEKLVKMSKVYSTTQDSIRQNESIDITTYDAQIDNRIIDAVVTIIMHKALQKIKLRSNSNILTSGDSLFLQFFPQEKMIKLFNQNNVIISNINTETTEIYI